MSTLFANVSGDDAQAAVAPFIADVQSVGATIVNQTVVTAIANDIVGFADDRAGYNTLLGSRLIPATQYEHDPAAIGAAYKTLFDQGAGSYVLHSFRSLIQSLTQRLGRILGHLVAGGKLPCQSILYPASNISIGKVAENANISSAILPKWRTAKTHVCAVRLSARLASDTDHTGHRDDNLG